MEAVFAKLDELPTSAAISPYSTAASTLISLDYYRSCSPPFVTAMVHLEFMPPPSPSSSTSLMPEAELR